jgi:hypothetical protein
LVVREEQLRETGEEEEEAVALWAPSITTTLPLAITTSPEGEMRTKSIRKGREQRAEGSIAPTPLSPAGWHASLGGTATGAMAVAEAQRTQVVRIPGFLGDEEVRSTLLAPF